MRIILVEFLWHARQIASNAPFFAKDIIISLDPEISYFLKNNKISYFETYEFCNHKELWGKYKDITNQTIKIAEVLDETLWKVDERFKNLNWKLFNDYHYVFKISFDQLFYYSELITKLVEKFKPEEIVVADTGGIVLDEYYLINSQISIIKYLLKKINNSSTAIKITFVKVNKNEISKFSILKNYKGNTLLSIKVYKKKIKNIINKINFSIINYLYKPKYLSIGCIEIESYKRLYPNKSKMFINYKNDIFIKRFKNNYIFFEQFIYYLKNRTNFFNLIKNKSISFELIFYEILLQFTKQLDFLIKEHYKAKKVMLKLKPTCVIFQSMAPFYLSNILYRKNCIDLKIPFITWSHGGYGLTYSIAPYDPTDFRFCKNHIAYGDYLKDLVMDDKCILKKLNLNKNQKIFPVGSFRFDYDNKVKNKEKNIKPTILFMMGFNYKKNNFYFGRNREKRETILWELIYEILFLLKKYQNKYNIIFKDYPEGRKSLWKKILKDINADKILYISDEYTVNDLLRKSDLNILPWISSTFFEALYFDSDMFVIEEDVFEKAFEEKLKGEIFYFENIKNFKNNLEKYLDDGIFYKYKKNQSKKYLLNFGAGKKDLLLKDALDNISKSNGS